MSWSRRTFLKASLGGLAAGGAAAGAAWRHRREVAVALAEELTTLLPADADPGALGAAYLAAHPDEASREQLLRALHADLGLSGWSRPGNLDRRVVTRVREDYRDGRTTIVAGWILSRTEARLAALQSLRRAASPPPAA